MKQSRVIGVGILLGLGACKPGDTTSPLIDLANRLYLDGQWSWSDSVTYSQYVPAGDSVPHWGLYVLEGTASLEPVDSTDVETYVLDATATLMHLDSASGAEVEAWSVPDLTYQDTVTVRNDTIYRLGVEPIPPQANPNTNFVRWVLQANQLWCTNWLTDTLPAGNTDNCRTVVTWRRDGR